MLDVDTIIKMAAPEERIYRIRCVEGWSIVVPWVGFSLSALIKRAEPLPKAKFVEFTTLFKIRQMPGQRGQCAGVALRRGIADGRSHAPAGAAVLWHVRRVLPNQDGAPLRMVVPWKYGFKSIKASCAYRFVEQPARQHLAYIRAQRVRVLLQRESECGPSALEPGHGAPHWESSASGRR